jgi:hypothetical protein
MTPLTCPNGAPSTWDQLADQEGIVTSVAFIQGSTADPKQRPGVPHAAFKLVTKDGKDLPKYQPRRSIEFRLMTLYDWPADVWKEPLPRGWTMHATEYGRRYFLHDDHGPTWKHPGKYPHDELFRHLELDALFHPPTKQNPIFA